MAILEMKKIEIIAMLSDSKAIVDMVQRCGILDITATDCNETDQLYGLSSDTTRMQFEKFLESSQSALKILQEYVPQKTSMLSSFAPREEMTVNEFTKKTQSADEILSKCYSMIALDKEIKDSRVEIIRANTSLEMLKPWLSLEVPTSYKGTNTTHVFIGSAPKKFEDANTISEEIAKEYPELDCDFEIIYQSKTLTSIVAICKKEDADKLEQSVRALDFVPPADPTRHPPKHRHDRLEKVVAERTAKISECEEKIKQYTETREDIEFLEDYLSLRVDKYKALDKIVVSNNIFVLTGYIPSKKVDAFVRKLESHFDVSVNVMDPDYDNEDEIVPTAVESKGLPATMESVTNMYSPPSHNDIDPNPAMSIFYFMLCGMMLGDAGYGIIMVIVTLFIKLRYKLEESKAKFINYGLLFGIGTVFWGAMFNSWFGDLPAYISGGLKEKSMDIITAKHLYWFNPLDYTSAFLLMCFFVGIIHLIFALLMNVYKMMKKKHEYFEAVFENLPPILILIGVIPLLNSYIGGDTFSSNPRTLFIDTFLKQNSTIFSYILISGAILMIISPVLIAIKQRQKISKVIGGFFSGLNNLYGAASGYLGDILSYARLLALGLCTGVIACVINELASMIGNPIFFVIIALFAHPINMAINIIGAYVHTNRLQYVEFFSKFYEGGGKLFEPLEIKTKTFKIKEEI